MFSEIFQLKCVWCGEACHDDLPICSSCISKLPSYEHKCENCGYPTAVPSKVCGHCLRQKHWDRIFVDYRYTGAVKSLLRDIKFGYRLTGLDSFTKLIHTENFQKYDIITAVPSHFTRKFRRFAHPSEKIADFIAKIEGSHYTRLLTRLRKTEYQYKLRKSMRILNVKGAFSCESDLRGLKILLVDDIITTGSTVTECCGVLKAAGAEVLDVYVFSGGAV